MRAKVFGRVGSEGEILRVKRTANDRRSLSPRDFGDCTEWTPGPGPLPREDRSSQGSHLRISPNWKASGARLYKIWRRVDCGASAAAQTADLIYRIGSQ
jgi:hypothetical protein